MVLCWLEGPLFAAQQEMSTMESGAHLLLSAVVIISSACLTVLFLSLKIKKLKKKK